MTAYTPDVVTIDGSVTANKRTGTASSDTVPANSLVLFTNTGAGSHNVDLGINFLYRGLSPGSAATPGKRRITIAAGVTVAVRIPGDAGDANGQCSVTIDATAAEVTYYVIGA